MYDKLKYNESNFNFYYEGNNTNLFSFFNSEIYNEKLDKLVNNDKILCYNYKKLEEKWEYLLTQRVPFEYLIEKEKEVVFNEILKGIEVLDFFSWYLINSGHCYINVIDEEILNLSIESDTIIFIQDLNGNIIGVLLPDGTIAPYDEDTYGTPQTTENSIVISSSNVSTKTFEFCGEETLLEKEEYDFC